MHPQLCARPRRLLPCEGCPRRALSTTRSVAEHGAEEVQEDAEATAALLGPARADDVDAVMTGGGVGGARRACVGR